MEYQFIETTLKDGSKTTDIKLFDERGRSIRITCETDQDALEFIYTLERLVDSHTDDYLVERG